MMENEQTTRLGLDKVAIVSEEVPVAGIIDKEDEQKINYNKPWRIIIKRTVCDGRNNYEDLSESDKNY